MTGFSYFPWIQHLDEDDRQHFFQELREVLDSVDALGAPGVERTSEEYRVPLETLLWAWQATAEALADPLTREVLLGNTELGDFGPVLPPTCLDPELCTTADPCPVCDPDDEEE